MADVMQGRRALATEGQATPQALHQQEPNPNNTLQGSSEDVTASVTVVVTAQELQRAVVAGTPHIEVQAHLDLTTLPLLPNGRLLGTEEGVLPQDVKSITVRPCSNLPLSANPASQGPACKR